MKGNQRLGKVPCSNLEWSGKKSAYCLITARPIPSPPLKQDAYISVGELMMGPGIRESPASSFHSFFTGEDHGHKLQPCAESSLPCSHGGNRPRHPEPGGAKNKQKTQNLEHPAHRRKNLGPLKMLLHKTRKCRSGDRRQLTLSIVQGPRFHHWGYQKLS